MSEKQRRPWIFPKINDPRLIFLAYILSFVTYALISPGFARTPQQLLAAFVTAAVLDFLLITFYKKVYLFPLSGIITSSGIFLLCDTPFVWPFILAAFLAIFSKHFLTINGRHIFNPNNFAVVLLVLFLPNYVTIAAGRWGSSVVITSFLLVWGFYLSFRVNRLHLIVSYLITFFIGAVVRSSLRSVALYTILSPSLGSAFQLFLFYHITDPVTTPQLKKHQLVFGVCLGIIDAVFRYHQNKFAPFLSLFIMTGLYSFVKSRYLLDQPKSWPLDKKNMEAAQ